MAKLTTCPRCQSQFDSTNVPAGSTTRCPECGGLVRVGGAPAEAPAQPSATPGTRRRTNPAGRGSTQVRRGGGGSRETALFRKMNRSKGYGGGSGRAASFGGRGSRRKSSGAGAIIGIVVGVLVLIVLVIVIAGNRGPSAPPPKKVADADMPDVTPVDTSARAGKRDLNDPALTKEKPAKGTAPKKEPAKKEPSVRRTDSGQYVAPSTFEKDARKEAVKMVKVLKEIPVDDATYSKFQALAVAGNVNALIDADYTYFTAIIKGFLSENPKIASSAWQAMHEICVKRKISTADPELPFKNPIKLDMLNSAMVRGGAYNLMTDWYGSGRNKETVLSWDPSGSAAAAVADATKEDWARTMKDLRAGGAFEDESRPEGQAFKRVKSMGRSAYPYLVEFIDNEDPGLGRAAVTVLNALTGRQSPLPKEDTKAGLKAEWDNWVKGN